MSIKDPAKSAAGQREKSDDSLMPSAVSLRLDRRQLTKAEHDATGKEKNAHNRVSRLLPSSEHSPDAGTSSFFRFGYIRFWRNGGGNLSAHRQLLMERRIIPARHGDSRHASAFPVGQGFPHEEAPRPHTCIRNGNEADGLQGLLSTAVGLMPAFRPKRPLPDDPAPQMLQLKHIAGAIVTHVPHPLAMPAVRHSACSCVPRLFRR